MTMNSPLYWEAQNASVRCLAALGEKGIVVRPTSDPSEVSKSIDAIGKPYLTPMLDPAKNDFSSDNYFWLMAYLGDELAIVGGGRVDVISGEGASFLANQFTRNYGPTSVESVNPEVSKVLNGRVCYLGDLYSKAGLGLSGANRRMFLGVANYIASSHFRADVTYSFMRDRDVRRGSADTNGFDRRLQNPINWGEIPDARSESEIIVYRRRETDSAYFSTITLE